MKSPVSGKAGSIRLMHLTPSVLILAEKHGKRLDERSQLRKINDQPALTTTGLDLVDLFEDHIEGAMLHGGKKRAIHILLQFPKDLVDGEDPEYMLKHARGFIEVVFGKEAIFADRLDRDEEGRHNVDVFVAPRYIKPNLSGDKVAISTSRPLKELARLYYPKKDEDEKEDTRPVVIGRALQDALHDYFRNVMELPGVQRGSFKLVKGSDWKQAEQLRLEEMDKAQAEVEKERARLAKERMDLAEQRVRTNEAEQKAKVDERRAKSARAQAEAALETAREEAVRIERDAELKRDNAAEALAAAELSRRNTADAHMEADRLRSEIEQGRRRADDLRHLEQQQFALLERALDDEAGLHLRTEGQLFAMDKEKMTPDEKRAYESPWPKVLAAMARTWALILERVRETVEKLQAREETAEKRTLQSAKDRQALAEQTIDLKMEQASNRIKETALNGREASMKAISNTTRQWTRVINLMGSAPDNFKISPTGATELSEAGLKIASDDLRRHMKKESPEWFKVLARHHLRVRAASDILAREDAQAKEMAAKLTDMITRAGPVLTPSQEEVAKETRLVISQHLKLSGGTER